MGRFFFLVGGIIFIAIGVALIKYPESFLTLFGHENLVLPSRRKKNLDPSFWNLLVNLNKFGGVVLILLGVWLLWLFIKLAK